jgi:hypothetical protein
MCPSEQRVPHCLPHCLNRRPRGHGGRTRALHGRRVSRAQGSTPATVLVRAITRGVYRGRGPPLPTERGQAEPSLPETHPFDKHVSTFLHAGRSAAFECSWSALAPEIA